MTEEHALQRYKIESITVYLENQCTKIVRKRRWNSPTLTRTPNTKHQKYKNHSQELEQASKIKSKMRYSKRFRV